VIAVLTTLGVRRCAPLGSVSLALFDPDQPSTSHVPLDRLRFCRTAINLRRICGIRRITGIAEHSGAILEAEQRKRDERSRGRRGIPDSRDG
jgi:hypothetical protein